MNKQTQALLGVAVVLGVGYYLWAKSKKKNFANFMMSEIKDECRCHIEELGGVYLCGDGQSLAKKSKCKCGECKGKQSLSVASEELLQF